jgi:hypothetical protein
MQVPAAKRDVILDANDKDPNQAMIRKYNIRTFSSGTNPELFTVNRIAKYCIMQYSFDTHCDL